MTGVGFEPTHPKIADLKSAPLDHSGIQPYFPLMGTMKNIILFKYCSMTGSNRRPSAHKTDALTN